MKAIKLFSLIISVFIFGCNSLTNNENRAVDSINKIKIDTTNIVNKDSLVLNGNLGVWSYKSEPFYGYAVKFYSNDSIKEKTGFVKGKKQGVYNVWFENGVLKLESYYDQNVLQGIYKSWWNNGVLASESNYVDGRKQGLERKWFDNGNVSKRRNLLDGRENGLQQAWLDNGKLYVNYEAKNGRIFGMRRANSCYKLEDEVVTRKEKK